MVMRATWAFGGQANDDRNNRGTPYGKTKIISSVASIFKRERANKVGMAGKGGCLEQ